MGVCEEILHETICFNLNLLIILPGTPHCISSFSCLAFFIFLYFVLIPLVAPEHMPLESSRMLPLCFSYLTCILIISEALSPVCLFQKLPPHHQDPAFLPFTSMSTYTLHWDVSIYLSMASSFVAGTELSPFSCLALCLA